MGCVRLNSNPGQQVVSTHFAELFQTLEEEKPVVTGEKAPRKSWTRIGVCVGGAGGGGGEGRSWCVCV